MWSALALFRCNIDGGVPRSVYFKLRRVAESDCSELGRVPPSAVLLVMRDSHFWTEQNAFLWQIFEHGVAPDALPVWRALNSDVDIKILFRKVDSREKKQL